MSIISYAQNFEDVMLWRALKHVEHGFYIDVGAAWPTEASVTKAFYERGWHGINIEPNPKLNEQLRACRPRDINLKLAVGDCEGTQTLNLLAETGLSTLDDAIAEKHQAAGWIANRQEVQVTTVASIWQEHVPTGQAVHFLKVDIEGFEEAALKGNVWSKYRPWVVVVEATLPLSQEESHGAWEPVLINASYQFAYADGLNRFYIAQEHSELLPAFKYPPNVFDEFKLVGQHEAEAEAQQADARATQAGAQARQAEAQARQAGAQARQAEAQAQQADARATQFKAHEQQAEARATQAEAQAQQAEARATQAEAQASEAQKLKITVEVLLAQVMNSRSWRISAPLRWCNLHAKRFIAQAKKLIKKVGRPIVKRAVVFVNARPVVRKLCVQVINMLGLDDKMRSINLRFREFISAAPFGLAESQVVSEISDLSPQALRIYQDLTEAIETNKKVA